MDPIQSTSKIEIERVPLHSIKHLPPPSHAHPDTRKEGTPGTDPHGVIRGYVGWSRSTIHFQVGPAPPHQEGRGDIGGPPLQACHHVTQTCSVRGGEDGRTRHHPQVCRARHPDVWRRGGEVGRATTPRCAVHVTQTCGGEGRSVVPSPPGVCSARHPDVCSVRGGGRVCHRTTTSPRRVPWEGRPHMRRERETGAHVSQTCCVSGRIQQGRGKGGFHVPGRSNARTLSGLDSMLGRWDLKHVFQTSHTMTCSPPIGLETFIFKQVISVAISMQSDTQSKEPWNSEHIS